MFENKLYNGIHYSRFIASWMMFGNPRKEGTSFKKWLKSIGLPDDVIHDIWLMTDNGKMELESSVARFRKGNK